MLSHLSGKARAPAAQQAAVEKLAILIHGAYVPLSIGAVLAPLMTSMVIDGVEITSDVPAARQSLLGGRALRGVLASLADLLLRRSV